MSKHSKRAGKAGAKKADAKLAKQVRVALRAVRKNAAAKVAVTKNGQPQTGMTGARYDTGLRFDSGVRYVVDDPTPVPGSAKVKLELKTLSDADLVGFGHSHDEAIDGNPYFPTPEPTVVVFDAALAAYEAKLAELENHRITGKNLTEQRSVLRTAFEKSFTERGTYVQMVSKGDADWIASAGLPVRNGPTPTGVLPPPQNLRVDRTQLDGQLQMRWNPVTGAKGGYMLEMAEVVDNVAVNWVLIYMGGKPNFLKTGLDSGKTYAFRAAAVGGEGGKSAFSPEVWRMAA